MSHTAQVYLDGALIARHYNAYTPFSAVVRGVPAGEHTLEIVADNRFSEESALHVPNDYMSYGGISRPVSVEQVGSAYLRFLHVTPHFAEGKWRAHVRVCVENLCEEAPMSVQVCLAGERLVFAERTMSAGETVLEGEVTAENASPWSPASPVLYTAEARLLKNGVPFDDLIERFGFREVRCEGGRILLNGAPLRILGVCRHEDHPDYGCALPFAAMAHDLMLIRSLGANSVRTAHYPNDERFLDLCDELGILVWEENHARGLSEEQMRNPPSETLPFRRRRDIFAQIKKRARRTYLCGGRVEISRFPGHMTTMSFAVNCAFRSAGKLSSVMSTSISSICAKV